MADGTRKSKQASLAQDILAFMEAPPPRERIFTRQDLAHFGDAATVDAAVAALERDHHIGSPAAGYWMPLEKWINPQGQTELAPPAFLPELLHTLWIRKGFMGHDSSRWFLREHGQGAGQWAVPAYENVGIESDARPEPLTLRWRNGMAHTVWHRQVLEEPMIHSTATELRDPQDFLAVTRRAGLASGPAEKDMYVNGCLQGLQAWNEQVGPHVGAQLCLYGDTGLSKGWGLTSRFSEDVDCIVLWNDAPQNQRETVRVWKEVTRAVHTFMTAWLGARVPNCHCRCHTGRHGVCATVTGSTSLLLSLCIGVWCGTLSPPSSACGDRVTTIENGLDSGFSPTFPMVRGTGHQCAQPP